MGKEYIVDKALCICKYGATPGILKVTDNQIASMNGQLTATTMTLGNVFNPPGFGMCRINPIFPKPCSPMITKWTDSYDGVAINGNSHPLTDSSKASCAMGSPDCISFQSTGQIPIPGLMQLKMASVAHQNDINPIGMPEALDENSKDDTPIINKVYWKDGNGEEIDDIPKNGKATLCVITENAKKGDIVKFDIQLTDEKNIVVSGVVDEFGVTEIKDINLGLE